MRWGGRGLKPYGGLGKAVDAYLLRSVVGIPREARHHVRAEVLDERQGQRLVHVTAIPVRHTWQECQ